MPLACVSGFFRWALAFGFAHAKKRKKYNVKWADAMADYRLGWAVAIAPLAFLGHKVQAHLSTPYSR
jgi:hypothetical protein